MAHDSSSQAATMSDVLGGPVQEPDPRPSLTAIYLRFIALLLLAAGLARACQILGITPDGESFADLTPAWRAGAVTLLLVDLFTAIGLWVQAAWGPVMWAVALVVEISMYTVFADLFGSFPLRVAAHAALFAAFLVLAFLDWRRTVSE
jgi:hypothetical protein